MGPAVKAEAEILTQEGTTPATEGTACANVLMGVKLGNYKPSHYQSARPGLSVNSLACVQPQTWAYTVV